jgi:hypothetical protein
MASPPHPLGLRCMVAGLRHAAGSQPADDASFYHRQQQVAFPRLPLLPLLWGF